MSNTALLLLPVAGKRVTLRGEGFKIPTIYYAATGPKKRRLALIIGSGYNGRQEEMYHQMGKATIDRGYNVITYEGPGQSTVRRNQNLGFIVKWEKVVTPIVDYLRTLPEVDTSAVALVAFRSVVFWPLLRRLLNSAPQLLWLWMASTTLADCFSSSFPQRWQRYSNPAIRLLLTLQLMQPGQTPIPQRSCDGCRPRYLGLQHLIAFRLDDSTSGV